jgi:crotonobetainyl-CoA:carnitine CoA-transferase CaiB-like acyl-CoA transferase
VSDVVIENYSPRVMTNFSLDYGALTALNPAVIMASMPGYGSDGPYRDRLAYGTTVEPESGLTSLMGYGPGEPRKFGVAFPDAVAGVHAAAAILLALRERDRTGAGQHVELAQYETMVSTLGIELLESQLAGGVPPRYRNEHPSMAPHGCYRCRGQDRWLTIAVRDEAEWRALCEVIGMPGLAGNPRFRSIAARRTNARELDEIISAWTRRQDACEAMELLQQAGVPGGTVLDAKDLHANPQLRSRGFFVRLPQCDGGTYDYPGFPARLSRTPASFRSGAPGLGEHNHEILSSLVGLSEREIRDLEAAGVIGERPPE